MVAEEPEDENDFLELHPSKSQQPIQMASNIEVSSPKEEAAKVLKSVFKCTHLLEHCVTTSRSPSVLLRCYGMCSLHWTVACVQRKCFKMPLVLHVHESHADTQCAKSAIC